MKGIDNNMADTQKINLKAMIEPIEIDVRTGKLDEATTKLREFYTQIQDLKEQIAIKDSWGDPIGLANSYGLVANQLQDVVKLIKEMENESGRLAGLISQAGQLSKQIRGIKPKNPRKTQTSTSSSNKVNQTSVNSIDYASSYNFKGDIERELNGEKIKMPGFIDDKGGTRFIADMQKAYFSANEKQKKVILETFRGIFFNQTKEIQTYMLAELRRQKGSGYDDVVPYFWQGLKENASEEQKKLLTSINKKIKSFSFEDFAYNVGARGKYEEIGADYDMSQKELVPIRLPKQSKITSTTKIKSTIQAPSEDFTLIAYTDKRTAEEWGKQQKENERKRKEFEKYRESHPFVDNNRQLQDKYARKRNEEVGIIPPSQKEGYVNYQTPSLKSFKQYSLDPDGIYSKVFWEAHKKIKSIERFRKEPLTEEQKEAYFQAMVAYKLAEVKADEFNEYANEYLGVNTQSVSLSVKPIKPFITQEGDVVHPFRRNTYNGEFTPNFGVAIQSDKLAEVEKILGRKSKKNPFGLLTDSLNGNTDRKIEQQIINLESYKQKLEQKLANGEELTGLEQTHLKTINESLPKILEVFEEILEKAFDTLGTRYLDDSNIKEEDQAMSQDVFARMLKRFVGKQYSLDSDGRQTPTGKYVKESSLLSQLRNIAEQEIFESRQRRQELINQEGYAAVENGYIDLKDFFEDDEDSGEGLEYAGWAGDHTKIDFEQEQIHFQDARTIKENISQSANRLADYINEYNAYTAAIRKRMEETGQSFEEIDAIAKENMSEEDLYRLDISKTLSETFNKINTPLMNEIHNKKDKLAQLNPNSEEYTQLSNEIINLMQERLRKIIKALLSSVSDRLLEDIGIQIKDLGGVNLNTSEFYQFGELFDNQMNYNPRSANKYAFNKEPNQLPIPEDFIEETGAINSPSMRRLLGWKKGIANLGVYGTDNVEQAIININRREAEIQEIIANEIEQQKKDEEALEKYNKDKKIIEEYISSIYRKYGVKTTKSGNKVTWSTGSGEYDDSEIKQDKDRYAKALKFLDKKPPTVRLANPNRFSKELAILDRDKENFEQFLENKNNPQSSSTNTQVESKEDRKDTTQEIEQTTQALQEESKQLDNEQEKIDQHTTSMNEATTAESNKMLVSEKLSKALNNEEKGLEDLGELPFTMDRYNENINKSQSAQLTDNQEQFIQKLGEAIQPLVELGEIFTNSNAQENWENFRGDGSGSEGDNKDYTEQLKWAKDNYLKYYKLENKSALEAEKLSSRLNEAEKRGRTDEIDVLKQMIIDQNKQTEYFRSRKLSGIDSKVYTDEQDFISRADSIAKGNISFKNELEQIDRELREKFGEGTIKDIKTKEKTLSDTIKEYTDLIKLIEEASQKIEKLDVDIQNTEETSSKRPLLEQKRDLLEQQRTILEQQRTNFLNDKDLNLTYQDGQIVAGNYKGQDLTQEQIEQIRLLEQELQTKKEIAVIDQQMKYAKDEKVKATDITEQKELNQALDNFFKIKKQIARLDAEQKANKGLIEQGVNSKTRRELEERNKQLQLRINELEGQAGSLDQSTGKFIYKDKDGNTKSAILTDEQRLKLQDRMNDLKFYETEQTEKTNRRLKDQKGIIQSLVDNFKRSLTNLVDYQLAGEVIRGIRTTVNAVIQNTKELNSNMVDLQIASGETYENIYGLTKEFNNLGRELGRSTKDIMSASNDWLRAGFQTQQAAELTRQSIELSTLGMINTSDATSYLISMMKGWKLGAEEVSTVVDKLTALDFQAAVSSGELAEALSRSSVSAQKAGLDLDTFLGYVTTVADVTQKEASVVGQSFQTLFARYQNVASGKFSASQEQMESGDYNEEEWSNLNDIETALKALGINLRDSIDHFREFDDVLGEIASKWDTFNNVQQAGIATSLAG